MTTGRLVWLATVALLAFATTATLFGPMSESQLENPALLFSLVVVSAVACIIGATIVIALGDKREMAEIGLLGSAMMAASVMPLVHGLVTPGVLYDDTAAFRTASFLSTPIALAVASPLFAPHSTFGRWASRHWRDWTLLSLLGVFAIAAVVVAYPSAIDAPDASSPITWVISGCLVVGMLMLSLRQLRYYDLGRQPANLVASLSLVVLSVTALLPLSEHHYSIGFWWLHIAGVAGVIGACVGMTISKRMSRSAHDLLAPVLTRDPLIAFELGLSPVVHRFVASLEHKDPQIRDHVVRTAEMAVRVGERCHLSPRRLRDLGLAALLHDIGKLDIPAEILDKPSRLTADEYEIVKLHAAGGAAMLLAEPTLASIAPIVRSHHERIDGRGYPDGLVGGEIPIESRIIAVCDAFDAMTHEHRFRAAMSTAMAFSVLREHGGSQWDRQVIDHLIAVLPAMAEMRGLNEVGRGRNVAPSITAESTTIVVDDVDELLLAVDAEI
jgi:HD-GYP domain-containing protein (c-di-GMP phosphodiesterase class II)